MRSGRTGILGCLAALCAGLLGGACHAPARPQAGPPRPGPLARPAEEPALRQRLPNGLRLLMRESHLSRVVAIQAWIEAGAAEEPEDQPGAAYACQHLLGAALAERGAALGAEVTAWTTADHAVFQLLVPSPYLGDALRLLADVLARPPLGASDLHRERPALLAAARRAELAPERAVTELLLRTAFRAHPYRRPVAGTREGLERLSAGALRDHFRRRYGADRATLVLVGDLRAAQAQALVAQTLGALPRAAEPAPGRPEEPPQEGPRIATSESDGQEAQLLLGFRGPAARSPDAAALDLAAVVLGHGEEARLSVEVRRNRQAASAVYAHSYTPRDPGLLLIGARVPPEQLAEAARATLAEVLRLAQEDVSPAELRRAQAALEADAAYRQETAAGLARRLGFFESAAGGAAVEARYWQQVREMTPRRLREALGRYLRPGQLTIGVLQPRPVAPRGRARARVLVEALSPREPAQVERLLRGLLAQLARPPADAAAPQATGPVLAQRLRSGARLLLLEDHGAPVLALQATWAGGLRSEDERSAGASHLLSQLLCRGTRSRSAEQVAREIASMEGSLVSTADAHSLGVRLEVLSAHWERGLALLADCLRNPLLPEEELERARRTTLDRLHAQEENPSAAALRLLLRALYPRHPYRFDPLGTPQSVAALSRRRLLEIYRHHYPLGQLTLAVVGDAAPAQVLARAEALLAAEEDDPPPALPAPPADPPPAEPVQLFRHAAAPQAHLAVGFPGAALGAPDLPAVTVLRALLGGEGGRLAALRDRGGRLYRVGLASLDGVEPGYLAVQLSTGPADLEAAQTALRDELRRLVDHPVDTEELERTKRRLAREHEAALQRRGQLAAALALAEALGLGVDAHRRHGEALLRVSAADVQDAARRYLDERRMVLAALLPEPRPPGVGRAAVPARTGRVKGPRPRRQDARRR